MNVRINKLLSETGLGSRREVEDLILEGRVWINGERAELSDTVSEGDIVELDGEELPVEDLLRDIAAEQKARIAQQGAVRIGREYYDADEDEYASHSSSRSHGATGRSGSNRNGHHASLNKPSKFRKERDEDFTRQGNKEGRPFKRSDRGALRGGERLEKKPAPHNDFDYEEDTPHFDKPKRFGNNREFSPRPEHRPGGNRRSGGSSHHFDRNNNKSRGQEGKRNGEEPWRKRSNNKPPKKSF